MKTILDKIVADKRVQVEREKIMLPVQKLETSIYFEGPCISLSEYILKKDKHGLIAEFKKASPSMGDINPYADPDKIPLAYMQAGAAAVSVLTEQKYFKGSNEDLTAAREWNFSPILRKDFIIDEYQIIEAKSIGADAILLILSILSPAEIKSFIQLAHQLGMEVLAEVHESKEYVPEAEQADLLGINARSLKEMRIMQGKAIEIYRELKSHKPVIAESGIKSAEDAFQLYKEGFDGFLIGTHFMAEPNPGFACKKFIHQLKELKEQ